MHQSAHPPAAYFNAIALQLTSIATGALTQCAYVIRAHIFSTHSNGASIAQMSASYVAVVGAPSAPDGPAPAASASARSRSLSARSAARQCS